LETPTHFNQMFNMEEIVKLNNEFKAIFYHKLHLSMVFSHIQWMTNTNDKTLIGLVNYLLCKVDFLGSSVLEVKAKNSFQFIHAENSAWSVFVVKLSLSSQSELWTKKKFRQDDESFLWK